MRVLKQFVFFLTFILPFSFSAHSAILKATSNGSNFNLVNKCTGVYVGTVFDSTKLDCSVGQTFDNGYWVVTSINPEGLSLWAKQTGYPYSSYEGKINVTSAVCAPPKVINQSTGICESPPTCGVDEVLNPDTYECEPVPFCDRDSTNDALFEAEQSCAAEGGLFSFQCSNGGLFDGPEGLTTKCTQPNECVLGYPNFPECLGDLDPTDPLPDSGGDFNGGSAGTSTPDAPSFDKTEPDAVTPNPETDTALLAAIQNLNRDNNQALVGLNTDLNKGLTNIDNQLSQLNETNNAIGQSIVDQINHDRALFEANKALALQQTGAINKIGSDITGALDSGFGDIGNKLNELAAGSKTTPTDAGCDTAFSCSGNAYECYMAKQAFETRCSSLEFAETDASGLQTELQPFGDALNVQMGEFNDSVSVDALKGDTLDVTNTMNTINESNGLNFDAGCPAPKNYDYGLGVFTIDYSPFCDLAVVIRALLMLAASIGSLMLYAKFL